MAAGAGPWWRRSRRAGVLAAGLVGIVLLAAACGGGSPPGVGGSAVAGSSNYQKALAYAQCMRSHGIPGWPDPNSQGNFLITGANHVGMGSVQFASANKACEHLLPNGGQETAAQLKQDLGQALRFAACMRSHGMPDFPDPTVQNGNLTIHGPAGFAPSSPQLQSAQHACRAFQPGGGA